MIRKLTQSNLKTLPILLGGVIFLLCGEEFSFGLPEVQEVVSGTAQISQPNSTTLQITADNNAIINYSSFNISENESVVINLPSADGQLLNRVLGNSASQLLGNLNSNGLFVLVNPSGIYIGPKAAINAASIIMSTRDISNADFSNGNYLFQKLTPDQLNKLLLNEGTITTQEGGFGVLIAGGIENKGKIIAPTGKIVLAAGDAVTLDISKDGLISVAIQKETSSNVLDAEGNAVTDQIKNTGTLEANGGTVILDADSASGIFKQGVNLQGYVTANKLENKDGVLRIVADQSVSINATVKATNIEVGSSTGKIPEKVEIAGGSLEAEKNITILAKKDITINANLTAQGIIHLEGQKIIDLTSALKTNTLKLIGQEFLISTNAVNLEVTKTLNDFVISKSSTLGDLITLEGDNLKITYPVTSHLTLKSDNPIRTTGTAIISAQKVSLLSNKFGEYSTPVRISADELVIHRLSGTIEIAQSTDQGGNISIRGPPVDGFGSILYNENTQLTLKADKVTVSSDSSTYFYGNITFYNFSVTTPDKELYFQAGKTYTFKDRLEIIGAPDLPGNEQMIKMRSQTPGSQWIFDRQTDNASLNYINISDAYATNFITIPIGVHGSNLNDANFYIDPVWDGGGADNNWDTGLNWAGDTAPTSGSEDAQFDGTSTKSVTVNNVGTWIGALKILTGYTGTITLATNMSITTFTQASGTINLSSYTLYSSGIWTVTGGTFTRGSSTVDFNGSGTQTIQSGGITFNNVIHSGAGTLATQSDGFTVAGTFNQTAGTFDASSGSKRFSGNITIGSGTSWTAAAAGGGNIIIGANLTFTDNRATIANIGDLQFDGGVTLTLASNIAFRGLTDFGGTNSSLVTSGYNLDIGVGGITVGGILDATTAGGRNSTINMEGDWSVTETFTSSTSTVEFDLSSGTQTLNSGGTGSGKTFNNLTHSGAGTLRLVTNAVSVTGTFTNSGGTFDADTNDLALTVTGLATLSGGTFTASSSATATFNGGVIISGGTFTGAAGTVDVNGALTLSSGTLTAPSGTFTVSTNWAVSGGTFTAGTGTVTLDSTSTGRTIQTNGTSFYKLTLNGSGGGWTLSDALDVDNNLTITNGTLDVSSSSNYGITVGGAWTNNGTFTARSGRVTFDGTAAQNLNGGGTGSTKIFYNVTISNTSGDIDMITSAAKIDGTLTINSSASFDLNDQNLTLATLDNNGTLKLQGGQTTVTITNMDTDSGTVQYTGTSSYTGLIAGNSYNSLSIGGSGTWTLNANLDVNGNLTLTTAAGKLDVSTSNYSINVARNWANLGSSTFTAQNGRVTFDGTAAQNLNGGGISSTKAFYNVTVSNTSGDIDLATAATQITGTLTINSSASFDLNDQNLTLATLDNNGTLKLQGEQTQTVTITNMDTDSGTVLYTGTSSYTGLAAGNNYYNLAFFSSGSGSWVLNAALTANGSLTITSGRLDVDTNNNYPLTVGVNWVIYEGTFYARAGTVFFNGSGSQVLNSGGTSSGKTFYNITHSGAGTVELAQAIDIDNDFTNSGGTWDTNGKNMTVGRNWSNSATFTPRIGTVTFDGSETSTISGSTTFYNLTSETAGKQLNFQAEATQAVTNTLTLTGTSGNVIKLRSTSDGTQWKINPTGTRSVTYVSVKDSYNIALVGIDVADGTSVNSGNNTGWTFLSATTSDNLNQSTKILALLKKLALKKLAAAKYIAHMRNRFTRQFNALRAHIASLQSIAHADEISDLPDLWSALKPYDVFGTDRFRLFNTQISLFEGSVYAKCYKDAGQECANEIILKPGDIVSVRWEKDPVLAARQNENSEKNIKNYLPKEKQNYNDDSSPDNLRYAILKTIEGQVEIRQKNSDWQKATVGMILHETDEMRTGKSSYAELLIDNQGAAGRLEIQEVTRLGLNTLALNEKTNEKTTLLDVAIGRVMIHVEKLKGDSKFEVRTPTSTMGVRGTVFEVVVEDQEGS